jgi:hypothetical protein
MKIETRTAVILLTTLLLGVLLGAVGGGTMAAERQARLQDMRRPGGFVENMEEVIRPRDAAQRDALRPIIQRTAERNRAIIDAANRQLHAELDSMRARLAPHLDARQRARLDDFARRPPPAFRPNAPRGPGAPGGPPSGGGPPPGEGPPLGGDPPPGGGAPGDRPPPP